MKKLRKLFAVLLAVCMMMSLLSVSASAEESHAEENALFKCEFASEHTHTGVDGTCYKTQLTCTKHMHEDKCYTDSVLTCTDGVLDQICGFGYEHVHSVECKHVHDVSKCGYGCEGLCAITEDGHDCTENGCHIAHNAECGYGCGKTEGEILDCAYKDKEEHTHIVFDAAAENEDPCYQYHVHVGETEAKDCYGRVLTCKTPEHTHVRGCLTDKAEATVKAVEILIAGDEERGIAATPSLAEMKAARTTQFVVGEEEGNYATANDASDAFDVYIEASFTARETAQAAYNAMPDELKPFVSEEILKRLTDTLDTWFLDKANSPTATTDEYTWYLGSGIRYESSAHFNSGGGWCQPYIFIDTTKYGGKTWKPDTSCEYSPGISNYEVAYCCDVDTGARNTTLYKRINLEDAEYYSEAAAQKIRAIVMNSYPFVTVDEMRENLVILGMNKDFVATLDRSDMIAAVQWAVWSQANGDDAWLTYSYTRGGGPDRNNVTIHQYANELWYWWGKDYVNQNAKYKTETLAAFLANLNGVALKDDQVVIGSLNLAGAPVLLKDGAYEVALKITLNSGGSSEKDNLTIKVTAGESTETIPVKHGTKEYVVTITVANNTEIKAEVIALSICPLAFISTNLSL